MLRSSVPECARVPCFAPPPLPHPPAHPGAPTQTRRGALPSASRSGVWSCAVGHVMLRMVEGFSRVPYKKCSLPGRGLMQLDVKALWGRIVRVLTTSYVPPCALPQ
jgi:hypothetical protein